MHRIYQFGSIPLPPAMPEDDLSTGQADSTLQNTAGGGIFDVWGTARRLPRKQQITFRGKYELSDSGRFTTSRTEYVIDHAGNFIVDHAGNRIVADYAALALRRHVDQIKAAEGTRQNLYRRREDDSAVEWKLARLLKVSYVREIDDAGAVAQVEALFETMQACWRANTATTVTSALPAGLALQNGSDVPVNDGVLTVTASGAISQISITGPGIALTWAGSLTAGQALVIDAGNQTIRRAGVDAYSGLSRGAGHTAAGWLPIAVGASILWIQANGAGTASLSYYEQHL